MVYEVRRPTTDGPDRWGGAAVVSRHRTIEGALRSLRRQQEGARRQGGYCRDAITVYTPFGFKIVSALDDEILSE
jgi:hypothetical protein